MRRKQRTEAPNAGAVGARAACSSIWSVIVPADGTSAAHWRERRLRCVPVIWQLSDKPLLACKPTGGVPRLNNNEASVKIGPEGPSDGCAILRIIFRELAHLQPHRCNCRRSSPYGGNDRIPEPRRALAKVVNPEGMAHVGRVDSSGLRVVFFIPGHRPGHSAGPSVRHVALRRIQEDRGRNLVRRERRFIPRRRRERGDCKTTDHRPGIAQDRRTRPLCAARAQMRRFAGVVLDHNARAPWCGDQ